MNLRKHFTITLAVIGLALGFTTVQANAQPVLKGTFELPTAAYFGDTLLQPGQYTIWMSTEARDIASVPTIHLSGEGVNTTFLAIARPDKESARNALVIADLDGTYVIRAFDAGMLGETFSFGVTKKVKSKALRASAEPAMSVPVSAGAGF
jgi:hypothetical protein